MVFRRPKGACVGDLKTLYINRPLLNADDLIAWAKDQGFGKTMPAANMHITQIYSKTPVDWGEMGDSFDALQFEGGAREVEPLGDNGAVVLKFEAGELSQRWSDLIDRGAVSDYPSFTPHVTITWDGSGVDLSKVKPYTGLLKFGPERFEKINEDWQAELVEKRKQIFKSSVDAKHGIVFGFAIVCKIDGEDYYDLNVDKMADGSYKRVPEHIPEDAMIEAAADFASKAVRPGNEMHGGPDKGDYLFMFPMTEEIAKALDMTTRKSGLLVGFKPPADVLAKFVDGTYSGFSIEGVHLVDEEVA